MFAFLQGVNKSEQLMQEVWHIQGKVEQLKGQRSDGNTRQRNWFPVQYESKEQSIDDFIK